MSKYSVNTREDRVGQLVLIAAFKFSGHRTVTTRLHKETSELNGKSPIDLALESPEGLVRALQYIDKVSVFSV